MRNFTAVFALLVALSSQAQLGLPGQIYTPGTMEHLNSVTQQNLNQASQPGENAGSQATPKKPFIAMKLKGAPQWGRYWWKYFVVDLAYCNQSLSLCTGYKDGESSVLSKSFSNRAIGDVLTFDLLTLETQAAKLNIENPRIILRLYERGRFSDKLIGRQMSLIASDLRKNSYPSVALDSESKYLFSLWIDLGDKEP